MNGLYQGGVNNFADTVTCPICGCDCVHIAKVLVNQGGEVDIVTHNDIKHVTVANTHRGTIVKVLFWCEDDTDHNFVKVFQFHKGSVYQEDQTLKLDGELWRD